MKADRIERAIQKIYYTEGLSNEEIPAEYFAFVKLLHREQSFQRARVRRIIKAESARLARMDMTSREGKAWITAKQNVLADILDALNRRIP